MALGVWLLLSQLLLADTMRSILMKSLSFSQTGTHGDFEPKDYFQTFFFKLVACLKLASTSLITLSIFS